MVAIVVSSVSPIFVSICVISTGDRIIVIAIVPPIISAVAAVCFLGLILSICVCVAFVFGFAVIVTGVVVTVAF